MVNPEQSQSSRVSGTPQNDTRFLQWERGAEVAFTDGDIAAHRRTVILKRSSPSNESLSISFITADDYAPVATAELCAGADRAHFIIRPPEGPFGIKVLNQIAWHLFDAFEQGTTLVREKIQRSTLIEPVDPDTFQSIGAGRIARILLRPWPDLLTQTILPSLCDEPRPIRPGNPDVIRFTRTHLGEWAVIRAQDGFSLIVSPRDVNHGQRITLTFTENEISLQEILRAAEAINSTDSQRSAEELRTLFSKAQGRVSFTPPREISDTLYSPILVKAHECLKLPKGCVWHSDMPSTRVSFSDFFQMARGAEFFGVTTPSSLDSTISEVRGWLDKDRLCRLEVRNRTIDRPEAPNTTPVIQFTFPCNGTVAEASTAISEILFQFAMHREKSNFVSSMIGKHEFAVPGASVPHSLEAGRIALARAAAGDLVLLFENLSRAEKSKHQPSVEVVHSPAGFAQVLFKGRAGATLRFDLDGPTLMSAQISTNIAFVGLTTDQQPRAARFHEHYHTVGDLIQAFRRISWIESHLPARFTTVARLMKEGFR